MERVQLLLNDSRVPAGASVVLNIPAAPSPESPYSVTVTGSEDFLGETGGEFVKGQFLTCQELARLDGNPFEPDAPLPERPPRVEPWLKIDMDVAVLQVEGTPIIYAGDLQVVFAALSRMGMLADGWKDTLPESCREHIRLDNWPCAPRAPEQYKRFPTVAAATEASVGPALASLGAFASASGTRERSLSEEARLLASLSAEQREQLKRLLADPGSRGRLAEELRGSTGGLAVEPPAG